ncbi:hypothetical protein [Aquamicrobium defluvii]|uniref:Uncharacterized protein n=1 Tax=Aquamicrobium defluvii TaxID=69279 RepID=A0A4R6YG66_9HYPH|nr:hypothetical protein [Aquamicrobium defluvii]TDR35467.1 hypothetical protein DES43_109105 [Aquamicrobium defluvii]
MTSAIEIRRQLAAMDEAGWAMVGLEDEGCGWMRYMRDDEHPRFMRQYRNLRDKLFEEEEPNQWLH